MFVFGVVNNARMRESQDIYHCWRRRTTTPPPLYSCVAVLFIGASSFSVSVAVSPPKFPETEFPSPSPIDYTRGPVSAPIDYTWGPVSAPIDYTPIDEACPLIPDCCEEDCCGKGISWEPPFCVLDENGPGFNGTPSDTYVKGCVERLCCERACCSKGMIYDRSLALCFPFVAPTPSPTTTPRPLVAVTGCTPTLGPCVGTYADLKKAVSSSTGDDVIAICGNNVPIVTESAVEINQPNISLCCSGPDECLMKSSGSDRNLHVTGSDFTLKNFTFLDGKSTRDGGGNVAIDSGGHHQIIGCEFRNGQASWGGNLEVSWGADKVTLLGSNFLKGSANFGGGGASIDALSLTIDECTFEENTAEFGGGLVWGAIEDKVELKNSKFLSNVVNKFGGGFFASSMGNIRSLEILNCSFEDNQEGAGEAVIEYVDNLEFVNISGNSASGNDADGNGVLNGYGDLVDCGDGIYFIAQENPCVRLTGISINALP